MGHSVFRDTSGIEVGEESLLNYLRFWGPFLENPKTFWAWVPFLESPETLRAIFGCHNSLCISSAERI